MQLNMMELDNVLDLNKKCLAAGLTPNKAMLNTVLETGMRKADSDVLYDTLKLYVEQKIEPNPRQLKTMSMLKHIPDRLYVMLRKNFDMAGFVGMSTRQFEKPTFHKEKEGILEFKQTSNYKRHRLKKQSKK